MYQNYAMAHFMKPDERLLDQYMGLNAPLQAIRWIILNDKVDN